MNASISILNHPAVKRGRRIVIFAVFLVPLLYVAPVPTLLLIGCGVLDLSRHRKIPLELLDKYFTGNGLITWLLSPINLVADLLSYEKKATYELANLPIGHRSEIESCVREFIKNGDLIKTHVAKSLEQNKRCMLTFKWFKVRQSPNLKIVAFERDYRYVKTIAVSVFNTRERTSWHFGPLRLTLRVLYNLDPIESEKVFIEVDDVIHYWRDNPLFIFDDTRFHRSINDVERIRHCLFVDIVRPTRAQAVFNTAVDVAGIVAIAFQRLFYKNWSFIR